MTQENTERIAKRLSKYGSFNDLFGSLGDVAKQPQYANISADKIADAFGRAWINNPYVQNTRLKRLRSNPVLFPRNELEKILQDAQNNEMAIRQTSIALNYSSYPLYKIKTTIASIPTYKWAYMPQYLKKGDAKKDGFLKERRLVDKFCKRLNPTMHGRIIAQQSLDEGKIFRFMRYNIDKAHETVYAVDLQELPSDFCKIVGRNSDSYYTVAFNFTYFWQAGTSVEQFDPIFKKYLDKLMSATEDIYIRKGSPKRVINMQKASVLQQADPNISVEKINGNYFFWVNLPTDQCFTFGVDFSSPLQAPMLMGLFLTGADLAQFEYLQKQLLQVPLYAVLTGEIPYHDEKNSKATDDTRMSPTAVDYFRQIFYQMLDSNDTSGLDVYFAPVKNMQLQTLDTTPNATDIVTKSYQDFNTKAGITGIMSTTDKPMAALVASSQKIESQYAKLLYAQFEGMMNRTFERLNLNYTWRFMMFGDIFSEEKMLAAAKEGMTLGILADTYIYNGILGRTIEDDIATSIEMSESDLVDMRIPLKSTYTASGKDGSDRPVSSQGGRPSMEVTDITSEKTEESIDEGDGSNL